jgi:hypothetical protein
MAVLIEAISVVVRRERIEESYPGGWEAFVRNVPNSTLCADDHLARVGFMSPEAVQSFVANLGAAGLHFLRDGEAVDLAVVDQRQGPTTMVSWLEAGTLPHGDGSITIARRVGDESGQFVAPDGWVFETSLSAHHQFVATEDVDEAMEFLGVQDGLRVYRDRRTGVLRNQPQ